MACTTCNKTKCGCSDTPLVSIPTYQCPPDADCPVPSPCAEYYDSRCVLYMGAGIPDLNINQGDSLQSVIQRLVLVALGNISCVTGDCTSTFNIFPASVTSTTITVAWEVSPSAVQYQVQYKPVGGVTWTVFPTQLATAPTQLVITGLTAATEYLVRVNSICDLAQCMSVTLQIQTNS